MATFKDWYQNPTNRKNWLARNRDYYAKNADRIKAKKKLDRPRQRMLRQKRTGAFPREEYLNRVRNEISDVAKNAKQRIYKRTYELAFGRNLKLNRPCSMLGCRPTEF